LSLCVGGIATPSNREILVSEIDTCLQYQQLGGRAQAHQIAPHFVRPLIGGWMDHISDGIKWPSELRELQPEQIIAEWQAAVALQEKIQKDCVDLLAALRVQQEVVWAKQEEQAVLERRDLVNNLTSNPRAAVQEVLSQREAAIAASVAVAKLLAKGAEDYAVYLHLLACALQLAAPAAVAGKTQPILETSAVADGGAVISLKVLDGAVPEAHAQFESSSAKHAREGGEEEDLDSTEQQRDQACREEQLRREVQLYKQLWVAPGGPRLRGPPARRRGRLRPLPGRGRHRRRQRSRRPPLD